MEPRSDGAFLPARRDSERRSGDADHQRRHQHHHSDHDSQLTRSSSGGRVEKGGKEAVSPLSSSSSPPSATALPIPEETHVRSRAPLDTLAHPSTGRASSIPAILILFATLIFMLIFIGSSSRSGDMSDTSAASGAVPTLHTHHHGCELYDAILLQLSSSPPASPSSSSSAAAVAATLAHHPLLQGTLRLLDELQLTASLGEVAQVNTCVASLALPEFVCRLLVSTQRIAGELEATRRNAALVVQAAQAKAYQLQSLQAEQQRLCTASRNQTPEQFGADCLSTLCGLQED